MSNHKSETTPQADIKNEGMSDKQSKPDATIKVILTADSGYKATDVSRVTPYQYQRIIQILHEEQGK